MKLFLIISLLAASFVYASVVGSSVGSGSTRSQAYVYALGQVPAGAQVFQKIDSKLGTKWHVTLYWRK
jgi:hypothetical protein